jgi:AraC-like DNA-binding protein
MLQNTRHLTFRPSTTPALLSPVTVRSTGHYRVRNWHEDRTARDFSQVFWVEAGQLDYFRKGNRYTAGPGTTFFFPAGEPHQIDVSGTSCDYRWVTYDGPLVGNWLEAVLQNPAPRPRGPCPVELMNEIRDCLRPASPAAERDAANLGLRLLMELAGGTFRQMASLPPEEKLCTRLEAVLEEHHTDPEFGIEAASRLMERHRSTLFRTYRARRGITPSAYLQRLRLRRGLDLLRTSARPVTEIAHASGFRDANYFGKVIREATGESPRQVRGHSPPSGRQTADSRGKPAVTLKKRMLSGTRFRQSL